MGNGNSMQNLLVMDQNYQYQTVKMHPIFGEIRLFSHMQTSKKIALINKQIFESEQHKMKQENYVKRQQCNNPNLLKVLGFQKMTTNDLCSQIKYLSIQVEYYENNISQFKKKFTEKELYYLIFSLCDAMEYCQQQNNEINDLHPSKILVTDDGYIKLVDNIIAIESMSNFHQVKYNDRQVEYLAPEQLDLFTGQRNKVNQEKVNVFCLGLLISALIIKQAVSDYYLEEYVNINLLFQRLDSKFAVSNYSESLYNLIKDMLANDPDERLSYQQILAQKQYHHFVSNLDGDSLEFIEQNQVDSQIQSPHSESQIEYQIVSCHKTELAQSNKANQDEQQINEQLQQRIQKALMESNTLLEEYDELSPVKLQSRASLNGVYDSVQNPLVQLTDSRIKKLIETSQMVLEKSMKGVENEF